MVRFCSAFSLPIVSVLLPHEKPPTERCTRVKDLANLVFAYGEAVVPKVAVLCGPEALAAEKVRQLLTLQYGSQAFKLYLMRRSASQMEAHSCKHERRSCHCSSQGEQ